MTTLPNWLLVLRVQPEQPRPSEDSTRLLKGVNHSCREQWILVTSLSRVNGALVHGHPHDLKENGAHWTTALRSSLLVLTIWPVSKSLRSLGLPISPTSLLRELILCLPPTLSRLWLASRFGDQRYLPHLGVLIMFWLIGVYGHKALITQGTTPKCRCSCSNKPFTQWNATGNGPIQQNVCWHYLIMIIQLSSQNQRKR